MKIKDLLDVDSNVTNPQTGEVIKPAITASVFSWKPNGGGRKAAIIVSKLATNQARIARLTGETSEFQVARNAIVKNAQRPRADGAKGWEWVGGASDMLDAIAAAKKIIDDKTASAADVEKAKAEFEALTREHSRLQDETLQTVNAAIAELVEREVDATFEKIDLGDLFDLGCILSPEQVRWLDFMLDTSSLSTPAPAAA